MRLMSAIAASLLATACVTERVEEPVYKLSLAAQDFEVRDYDATIVAEVAVKGDAWDARFAGFGPLADYIFAKERGGEKIAMTAPVTQAPREKIAMTAPVTQQASEAGEWTIGFTMPAGYTMASLPPPANPDVKLVETPARSMAVYKFTGLASSADMDAARRKLLDKVSAAGLTPKGEPVFAFYDPPWILPFFRRNEVMMEVERR